MKKQQKKVTFVYAGLMGAALLVGVVTYVPAYIISRLLGERP